MSHRQRSRTRLGSVYGSKTAHIARFKAPLTSDDGIRTQLLELIVPFKEYYEARDVYRQLKPQKAEAVRNVRRLEARNKPFVEMQKSASCIYAL